MMYWIFLEDMKNKADKPTFRGELSQLSNSYVDNYKQPRSTLKKYGIL